MPSCILAVPFPFRGQEEASTLWHYVHPHRNIPIVKREQEYQKQVLHQFTRMLNHLQTALSAQHC